MELDPNHRQGKNVKMTDYGSTATGSIATAMTLEMDGSGTDLPEDSARRIELVLRSGPAMAAETPGLRLAS